MVRYYFYFFEFLVYQITENCSAEASYLNATMLAVQFDYKKDKARVDVFSSTVYGSMKPSVSPKRTCLQYA